MISDNISRSTIKFPRKEEKEKKKENVIIIRRAVDLVDFNDFSYTYITILILIPEIRNYLTIFFSRDLINYSRIIRKNC